MAEASRKVKKIRVRKALSVREQAELARAKAEASQKPSKISIAKGRLPRPSIVRKFAKALAIIFRPLRPLARPLRWLIPTYFINSWREVRQVSWPTRRETWRLTLAVFIFAVVFGSLVAGVDKGLDELFKRVILKQ